MDLCETCNWSENFQTLVIIKMELLYPKLKSINLYISEYCGFEHKWRSNRFIKVLYFS